MQRFLLFCKLSCSCLNKSSKQLLCRSILRRRKFRMPLYRTHKVVRRHHDALDQSVPGDCRDA